MTEFEPDDRPAQERAPSSDPNVTRPVPPPHHEAPPAPPPQPAATTATHSGPPPVVLESPQAPPAERPRKRRTGLILFAALLLGLVGGLGGALLYDFVSGEVAGEEENGGGSREVVELEPGTIEQVSDRVMPSVVQLTVGSGMDGGSGTGVILTEDGQILTNNHVVAQAVDGEADIVVSFSDGERATAEVVGSDPTSDLAVVQAQDVSELTPATLGSSDDIAVGQQVVAIGSPFGLESTVTTGIVSALNRPVNVPAAGVGDQGTIFSAIQTDAAINPGNSGGPLVDLSGQVVGINSAIRTDSGTMGSIGLGFAIPIDVAKRISDVLAQGDDVEHARIGVSVGDERSDDDLVSNGAAIQSVEDGSPAEAAGLEEGDIITAIDQLPVISADALVAGIRLFEPGTDVELSILRGGESDTVTVTLGSDADLPVDEGEDE